MATVMPNLAVMKAVNPETGEEDLLSALKYAIRKLNEEADIERGRIYHTLKGGLTERLCRFGIHNSYVGDFKLLMQHLNLARYMGAGRHTSWQVVDTQHFSEFVSDEWFKDAARALQKRHEDSRATHKLRQELEKLKGTPPESTPTTEAKNTEVGEATMAQIGELMVQIEDLEKELQERNSEIAALKAVKPPNLDVALANAIEKARARARTS